MPDNEPATTEAKMPEENATDRSTEALEIRSCPFCGEDGIDSENVCVVDEAGWWGAVVCPMCDTVGPSLRTEAEWKQAVISAWNKRAV